MTWEQSDSQLNMEHERFSFYVSVEEENLQNSWLSVWHTADEALREAFFFFKVLPPDKRYVSH